VKSGALAALIPAYRTAYRAAHLVRCVYWYLLRPHTCGVQLILLRGKNVLLVRHTYMHRGEWGLPGGGRRRHENPLATARRELAEELGIKSDLTELGEILFFHDFRYDSVHVFQQPEICDQPRVDRLEISEAQWFDGDNLPDNLTPIAKYILNWTRTSQPPRGTRVG
jgi:8-oxo-dGTP pyrophosphatase MutT (NUDIX family)